ncbi:MAG: protein adenylyltransferase SelO [Caulobacterales bacterium]
MLKESALYRPEPLFSALGPEFADPVEAADFPKTILRWRNQRWADRVGLGGLSDDEWLAHFGRFQPLPDNMQTPLAMRYHGHQFRNYNPQIGDGRGFLFAQMRDKAGRLLDLGTKGSGQTPYSRFGDGRLTLKGGLREVLAASMLEARGVYTSKAFSLIETGEQLVRHDEPSPTRSAVLVRLQHSHVRFGTFQRHAAHDRADLIAQLVDHCVTAYYPHLSNYTGDDKVAALYGAIVAATADLAASWMAAGFVHGVLNTDNMNVTGESFDYGPWRFLPTVQPGFTAAYFDETGLYSYGRQPEAAAWNLSQLGGTLVMVCAEEKLNAALQTFSPLYAESLVGRVCAQLGVAPPAVEVGMQMVSDLLTWMQQTQVGWDQTLFDLFCFDDTRMNASPQAAHYEAAEFAPIRAGFEALGRVRPERLQHPYFQSSAPVSMVIDEVEALWSAIAERDDWSLFEAKLADVERLRQAMEWTR